MRQAIISDIHANLEALNAVLADIDGRGIQDIVCLGDLVGYGPCPNECIDLVAKRCSFTLMGNHDYALLTEPLGFHPIAAQSIECTRELMTKSCLDVALTQARLDFLRQLPDIRVVDDRQYVHASLRDHLCEYILVPGPHDLISSALLENLQLVKHVCFLGHSHVPGVILHDLECHRPNADVAQFPITDAKMIVNVGSVGQPRDGDPRACYVELTSRSVSFHRVEYDYCITQQKLAEIGCMHSLCAERLAEGR